MSKKEPKKYGGDWAFRYIYRNDLPEYTADPKLLEYPTAPDRHYQYEPNTGSVADRFLFEVCGTNVENGVPCAPLRMGFLADSFYEPERKDVAQNLAPEDQELLAPPFEPEIVEASKELPKDVLYIKQDRINMAAAPRTYGKSSDRVTARSKANATTVHRVPETAEEKLALIKTTFTASKHFTIENMKHPSGNPNIKAVEILPVFPDFTDAWYDPLVLSLFDTDPLEKFKVGELKHEKQMALEDAILKPMKNPADPTDEFMSYYSPDAQSVAKLWATRKPKEEREQQTGGVELEQLDYPLVRDFSYQKSENNHKQLVWRVDSANGRVLFKRAPTKLTFKRRRAKGKFREEDDWERPTHLEVTRRPLSIEEIQKRRRGLAEELGIEEAGAQNSVDAMDVDV
ncbi:RNA polymerase-associated factor [Geranomyces variabilis]|nr:RNA polymerase-associated factor [Geranomyces variabilis]